LTRKSVKNGLSGSSYPHQDAVTAREPLTVTFADQSSGEALSWAFLRTRKFDTNRVADFRNQPMAGLQA